MAVTAKISESTGAASGDDTPWRAAWRVTAPGYGLRRLAAGLLVTVLMALPAAADPAPVSAKLDDAARADIARLEDYLNDMTTLQARFLQVSSSGAFSEGRLYISRPGRLRIEYDPPVPILIVANGSVLTYYDSELGQVSHVGLDQTPAGILVGEHVSFSGGELTVTGFKRGPGVLRISVVRSADPVEGELTLVFSDRPLILKKWLVTDAQGTTTSVSVLNPRFGGTLDPALFEFEEPAPPIGGN